MKICEGPRGILFYLLIMALPGAACLGRLVIKSRILHLSYSLSVEERERASVRAELRELEVERAAAAAPAHLLLLASGLGLEPPPAPQILDASTFYRAPSLLAARDGDLHAAQ